MTITYLMLVSFMGCFASNITGSSKLILVPIINSFLGTEAVVPAIAINVHKIFLLWQSISWQVLMWYLPGSGIGALLSAYICTRNYYLQKLPILLGLYLIVTAINPSLKYINKQYTVHCWYFLCAGLVCAVISKFLGVTISVLNDLCLNYGLDREQTTATKAANVLGINGAKICIYAICGAVNRERVFYSIAIAIATIPANFLIQLALQKIESKQFKHLANF